MEPSVELLLILMNASSVETFRSTIYILCGNQKKIINHDIC